MVPKTQYAPWNWGAPEWRLVFLSVLSQLKNNYFGLHLRGLWHHNHISMCLSVDQTSQRPQNWAWHPWWSFVCTDKKISVIGHFRIFSMSSKERHVQEMILSHFAWPDLAWGHPACPATWKPTPLQSGVGVLSALEILPSLMQCWDLFQTLDIYKLQWYCPR